MIKEIYDEKLKIKNVDNLEEEHSSNLPNGTQITNNHDKSFLVKTTENISNGLFVGFLFCFDSWHNRHSGNNFIINQILWIFKGNFDRNSLYNFYK